MTREADTWPTFGNLAAIAVLTSETLASSFMSIAIGRPRASDKDLPAGDILTETMVDETARDLRSSKSSGSRKRTAEAGDRSFFVDPVMVSRSARPSADVQ